MQPNFAFHFFILFLASPSIHHIFVVGTTDHNIVCAAYTASLLSVFRSIKDEARGWELVKFRMKFGCVIWEDYAI